jgi:hypothetical protein
MKRYGQLFDKVFTRDNLYQAYLDARKRKRNRRSTFEFETNLGGNLAALYDEIHSGFYRPRPYWQFWVQKPKPRLISAPAFRDRVAQHAIYRMIGPIFERIFAPESFACRIGYGTHRASLHVQDALRRCDPETYVLKLDIRKFFYRINRRILRVLVERKIKDERLLNVMMMYAEQDGPLGIPIGNLLSQLYALIYLNPLDHYIKRDLKIRHYARYVDDLVLIGLARDAAVAIRQRIKEFIADNLNLEFSKTTIARTCRGVNFVGWRTWADRRLLRKHSLYRFRRALKRGDVDTVVSILGHAKGTASMPHLAKTIRESDNGKNLPLSKRVRRLYNL